MKQDRQTRERARRIGVEFALHAAGEIHRLTADITLDRTCDLPGFAGTAPGMAGGCLTPGWMRRSSSPSAARISARLGVAGSGSSPRVSGLAACTEMPKRILVVPILMMSSC